MSLAGTTHSAVLFLIFNRPDTTSQVFARIRDARPPRLYIASDGPRPAKPDDIENCRQAREIACAVDWPCKVETLFRHENLGCKNAVSSAIDWFFSHEEEGIILEDDCLPAPSFFGFCDTLLAHYRHDTRVRHIAGSNFQLGHKRGDASYYFSRLTHVWGWAGWRRVWQTYDKNMRPFSHQEIEQVLEGIFDDPEISDSWRRILSEIRMNVINSWAYPLGFLNLMHNALCIIPNVNLVSNIGFDTRGTHTIDANAHYSNMPTGEIKDIIHPKHFSPDTKADLFTLYEEFQIERRRRETLERARKYKRLKYRLKRWLAAHGGPERWRNAGI